MQCPVCRQTRWESHLGVDGYRYVRCAGCGVVRLDPLPGSEFLDAYWSESYFRGSEPGGYPDYVADERLHRRNARRHLRRAARAGANPPGRLVEIGCAAGFLLDEARVRGWQVHGVELADEMRATAEARTGVAIARTIGALQGHRGSVDLVVMNQVLEHLVDPAGTLEAVAGLARPGGIVSIETWNRDSLVARLLGSHWQQISPPSVLWLLGRGELETLLRRSGFDVVQARPAWKLVSVDTVAGQLAARGSTGRALTRAVDALGARRLGLPYALGDLVVAIARRSTGDDR